MRYTEYVRLKTGRYQSVGKFGDDIYVNFLKEEFNSFETWSHEKGTELKKFYKIVNRPVLCSGYLGREYLDASLIRDM